MSTPLLQADHFIPDLYSDHADPGIQLSVMPGTVTQVVGADPVRVSHWMKSLAGLSVDYRGRLSLVGEDVAALDKSAWQSMRTRVAWLGRESRLLSVQTLMNNMLLPALYHGRDNREALEARARELLFDLGLQNADMLDNLPAHIDEHSYTLGVLVRVLLLEPELIIMDDFMRFYNKTQVETILQYLDARIQQQTLSLMIHHHDAAVIMPRAQRILFVGKESMLELNEAALRASENDEVKAWRRDQELD